MSNRNASARRMSAPAVMLRTIVRVSLLLLMTATLTVAAYSVVIDSPFWVTLAWVSPMVALFVAVATDSMRGI